MSNDFDIKGKDTRQAFASFGRKALPDNLHSVLALATYNMPENHIGGAMWLTTVSGCTVYADKIKQWSNEFAHAIANVTPIRKKFANKVPLIPSYNATWGDWAALDGIVLATGFGERVPLLARSKQLNCQRDSYKKVRNFVAGALLLQMDEFEESIGHSVWVHQQG